MKYISTKNQSPAVDFQTAIFNSMPSDGGLYVPEQLPLFDAHFLKQLPQLSFQEVAHYVASLFLQDDIPSSTLTDMIARAFDFPITCHTISDSISFLELFHGPTLAFKDVAAQFMAQVFGYYQQNAEQTLTVLVATSGDTGGAVAQAFSKVKGVRVIILYPKDGVSPYQELQLTTQGDHVQAYAVEGSFDDCQRLVKQAFADTALRQTMPLTSANSINITRLIPQLFYYVYAVGQLIHHAPTLDFIVPSGNFGNITAGLFAQHMGLPVHHFVAACNANDTVPRYLNEGSYQPHAVTSTLSNAMDVSDPSNFQRLDWLFQHDINMMRQRVSAFSFSDDEIKSAMRECLQQYNVIIDPHTAVAYSAAKARSTSAHQVIVATAHPAKFIQTVESTLSLKLPLPEQLTMLDGRTKQVTIIHNDYEDFLQQLKD